MIVKHIITLCNCYSVQGVPKKVDLVCWFRREISKQGQLFSGTPCTLNEALKSNQAYIYSQMYFVVWNAWIWSTRMEFYGVKLEWDLRWDWDEIWSLGHRGGKSINKCNQTTSKLFLEKTNDNSFWFTTGSLAISH